MAHLPAEPTHDFRRTAVPLATALLGYFLLVTIVITLSPFDFGLRRVRFTLMLVPRDIVANVLLFLPIGFLLRSVAHGPRWRPVAAAVAFSVLIESAQMFIRGRYVSPVDVVTNGTGAWLGLVVRDRLERWAGWHPGLAARVGLDIPVVGLLYLLIPQVWLSTVGVVEDAWRSLTTLLLGFIGSIIVVALQRHRWPGGGRLRAGAVPPLTVFWFVVGALPALAASLETFVAIALALAAFTALLSRLPDDEVGHQGRGSTSEEAAPREQRFEAVTLGRVLPLLVLYLFVAALWPPFRGVVPWHGAIGFANRLNNAGIVDLLLLLEQVGSFTLLGYGMAERRGRRELGLAADLRGLAIVTAILALTLEALQGWLIGPGASLVRAGLSTAGALYGVAVYHLARAHVRALRSAAHPIRPAGEAA